MNKRVINLDWLALSGHIHYAEKLGKTLRQIPQCVSDSIYITIESKAREVGSAQFRVIYDLFFDNCRVAELSCNPCSPILSRDLCVLRVVNRWLYNYLDLTYSRLDYADICNVIFEVYCINDIKLSRLDVCCDMLTTDADISFPLFLDKFANGSLRKVSRLKGSLFFEVIDHKIRYHCLNLGSKASDVSMKVYNKTKELNEVKDKPYIREMWRSHFGGEKGRGDVWRVEISMSSAACDKANAITGETLIDNPAVKSVALTLFAYYANKFCDFRKPTNDTNVTRWRRVLMVDATYCWQVGELVACRSYDSDRGLKMLLRRLNKEKQLYPDETGSRYISKIINEVIVYLVETNGLRDWYAAHVSSKEYPAKDRITGAVM